jgi:NAD-dependent deacetylase
LNVYPAASLLQYAPISSTIYVVDPGMPEFGIYRNRIQHLRKKASEGVPELVDMLIKRFAE